MTIQQTVVDRKRKQIHVHSVLYYHVGTSIISDVFFDSYCVQLRELHETYPETISAGYEHEAFSSWLAFGTPLPVTKEIHEFALDLVTGISQEGEGGTIP